MLQLTDSGVALGITVALQFTPMLLAGAWSGVVADRVDKRRLLLGDAGRRRRRSRSILGVITATGVVTLWMIYVLAALLGVVTALDNPSRRAFVVEMVGTEHVTNAVSLSSALFTAARVVGPAIAGLLIAERRRLVVLLRSTRSRTSPSIGAFVMMRARGVLRDRSRAEAQGPVPRGSALRVVDTRVADHAADDAVDRHLRVQLPGRVPPVGQNGPSTATPEPSPTLFALMSIGSVIGALVAAAATHATRRFLVGSALRLRRVHAPGRRPRRHSDSSYVVLVPMGATGIAFIAMANGVLQTECEPAMRGRVMALFSVAFLGSTPIGGPIVGWVSQVLGPRAGLALGGIASVAAAVAAVALFRRSPSQAPARTPTVAVASSGSCSGGRQPVRTGSGSRTAPSQSSAIA